MKVNETAKLLESGAARALMAQFYGEDGVEANVERYGDLLAGYEKMFDGEGDAKLFSSPGRTEISGNHTDHSHSKVLVGSINLDCVGAVGTNESNQIHIVSGTYNQDFTIDLNYLEPNEKEAETVDPVERFLQGFKDPGYRMSGFNAYIISNVISAAGVSLPTSPEILLCSALNTLFNEGRINTMAYTHIGKFTESNYQDKVPGLLDRMVCAMGDLVAVDPVGPPVLKVKEVDFDFGSQDHSPIIIQTGKDRTGLSADYSSVPAEMKRVVRYLRKKVLFQISKGQVIDDLAEVRQFTGDQSALRVLCFFEENKRMEVEVLALKENRLKDLLNNIMASGNSSWKWLQNCFISNDYQEQGIIATLALTELFIAGEQEGVCRVHGGGFADVIAAVLLNEPVDGLIHYIEKCTGEGGVYRMNIRLYGVICFNDLVQPCIVFFDIERRDLRGSCLRFPWIPVVRRGDLRYNDVKVRGYQMYSGAARTEGGLNGYDWRGNIGAPRAGTG